MEIVHELSWSASRASTFERCKRKYYYDYYLSWQGWSSTAPPARRTAYLLKKMTRMPMLAGDVLHQALERWFAGKERGRAATEEEIIEMALRLLRTGYKESRDGKWRMRPAKLKHLAEHHYKEPAIDEDSGAAGTYGKRYVERIQQGLHHFFSMPELEGVRAAEPGSYLACEELGTFELFGTKIYAIPDFAYRGADGRVRIYDWKSGAPQERDRFQLAVYVLYAEAMWGIAPSEIACYDVYLPQALLVAAEFSVAEISELRGEIERSIAAVRAVHFDADAESGDPEAFPMIPMESVEARECDFCNYRELCARVPAPASV